MLDAGAEQAARVGGATDSLILRLDGDDFRAGGHHGPIGLMSLSPSPTISGAATGSGPLALSVLHPVYSARLYVYHDRGGRA